MRDLGLGALLHDVGKADLPERVRHADPFHSPSETAAYREHVTRGVAHGRRMGLPDAALQVLAQHHEHADGSGFPARLCGEAQAMGARIVAIVNRYDNLCNPSLSQRALTPHEAVSTLFAQGRNCYDRTVLNAFIRMMGVYPAGSLVQLTDDRYAMVTSVNSSRPLKPRVLVHDDKVAREQALILNLEQVPGLGIRRSLPPARVPPVVLHYLDPRPRVAYYFEPLSAPSPAAAPLQTADPAGAGRQGACA
jgi:putative nucleotidyltransferase with HDIG domain